MRKFSAWFLLLIATFQWAGGLFSIKIVELISNDQVMTFHEERVAENVEFETGVKLQVKKIEDDFDFRKIGYSNRFVFTEKVAGEKSNFLITGDSVATLTVEKSIGLSNEQKQEGQVASILNCFLTEYITTDSQHVAPDWRTIKSGNHIYNTSSNYNFAGRLETPPPQQFS